MEEKQNLNSEISHYITKDMLHAMNKRYVYFSAFNIIVIILILLRSASYFEPFLVISINLIVFITMSLTVVLLGARSKLVFSLSIIFLVLATFFVTLGINVWAERLSVYAFQAFIIGIPTMLTERFHKD